MEPGSSHCMKRALEVQCSHMRDAIRPRSAEVTCSTFLHVHGQNGDKTVARRGSGAGRVGDSGVKGGLVHLVAVSMALFFAGLLNQQAAAPSLDYRTSSRKCSRSSWRSVRATPDASRVMDRGRHCDCSGHRSMARAGRKKSRKRTSTPCGAWRLPETRRACC